MAWLGIYPNNCCKGRQLFEVLTKAKGILV